MRAHCLDSNSLPIQSDPVLLVRLQPSFGKLKWQSTAALSDSRSAGRRVGWKR